MVGASYSGRYMADSGMGGGGGGAVTVLKNDGGDSGVRRGVIKINPATAKIIPTTTPPAALPTITPRLFDAVAAACWAIRAGLLVPVPVIDGVGVSEREEDTEGIYPKLDEDV
jgi:hypothetical protein